MMFYCRLGDGTSNVMCFKHHLTRGGQRLCRFKDKTKANTKITTSVSLDSSWAL